MDDAMDGPVDVENWGFLARCNRFANIGDRVKECRYHAGANGRWLAYGAQGKEPFCG